MCLGSNPQVTPAGAHTSHCAVCVRIELQLPALGKLNISSEAAHTMHQPILLPGLAVERLRLVNGTSTSGRLMVLYQGVWGTVCFDGFTPAAATVA